MFNVVNYVLAPEKNVDETAPSDDCSHLGLRDNISTSEISHPTPRSQIRNKDLSPFSIKNKKCSANNQKSSMKNDPSTKNLKQYITPILPTSPYRP